MSAPAEHGHSLGGAPRPVWKRAAPTYVGLFVLSALVFGGFQGAWSGSVVHGLVRGSVFGLLVSAVLGTAVVVGQRGNAGSWSPRRHLTVTVRDDPSVARRRVLAAFDQLRAQVTVDEPARLSARTGFGWKTWGVRVDVGFTVERTRTSVDVRVRPRVPTTLIDYGAAHHALDTVTSHLTSREVPPAR